MCTQFNSLEMLKHQCISRELLKQVIVSINSLQWKNKKKNIKTNVLLE